jgi:hypothetical protein
MKDIKEDIQHIKECIVEIQHDLKYHIKRTDLLESFMKNQIKFLLAVITAILLGIMSKEAFASPPPINESLNKISLVVPCTITVTSGKRSKAHNKRVGGAPRSYHLYDRARDITAPCLSTYELGVISFMFANGVIIYDNHVHIDNREKRLFWDRRTTK